MTHDLNGVRTVKLNGKGGGQHITAIAVESELLSGYIYPKLHRFFRRVERFRKRKMHYE